MIGELFAMGVVLMWSGSAICFDYVNRSLSSLYANVIRFWIGIIPITLGVWLLSGQPFFAHVDAVTFLWIAMAGVVGFLFGDFFLFAAYRRLHAAYTQLIMTLAPLFAACAGFFVLGERLSLNIVVGMLVTLSGIVVALVKKHRVRGGNTSFTFSGLGILFALLSALGQGVGLVLSKKGIQLYHLAYPEGSDFYISMAATQIRVITGWVGFTLWALCAVRGGVRGRIGQCGASVFGAAAAGAMMGLGLGVPLSLLALQYAHAAVVSTIIATVPLAIMLYQCLFKKEKVSVMEIVGFLLSVLGVLIMFV